MINEEMMRVINNNPEMMKIINDYSDKSDGYMNDMIDEIREVLSKHDSWRN